MHYHIILWARNNFKDLDGITKSVLNILCTYTNIQEDGLYKAWPAISSLSEDTGFSIASVKRALRNLVKNQIITITKRQDDKGKDMSNSYTIHYKEAYTKTDNEEASQTWGGVPTDPLEEVSQTPKGYILKDIKEDQDQDSLVSNKKTIRNKSGQDAQNFEKTKSKKITPSCPYEDIQNLFNELLPTLPRIKIMSAKRKRLLQALWRSNEKHQDLDFWRGYFIHVSESEFLLGKNRSKDYSSWRCTFDFIINENNFVNIIEGKYN